MSISTTTMMKEAIQALYPPRPAASRRRVRRCGSSSSSSFGSFRDNSIPARRFGGPDGVGDAAAPSAASGRGPSFGSSSKRNAAKSRFSELLLEHGEADLHRDWAVRASSSSLLPGGGGDDDDGADGNSRRATANLGAWASVDGDLLATLTPMLQRHVKSALGVDLIGEGRRVIAKSMEATGKKNRRPVITINQWMMQIAKYSGPNSAPLGSLGTDLPVEPGGGHRRLRVLLSGLEAANILLAIMASPGIDRRAVEDDTIEACVNLIKNHLQKHVSPALSNTGHLGMKVAATTPAKDDDNEEEDFTPKAKKAKTAKTPKTPKTVSPNKGAVAKSLKAVYLPILATVGTFGTVVERAEAFVVANEMDDRLLFTLSAAALSSLTVDPSAAVRADAGSLASLVQVSAMNLITATFSRYPRHRSIIVEDLFPLMLKLPTSKRSLRTYLVKKSAGGVKREQPATTGDHDYIQPISALTLLLVQSCVVMPYQSDEDAPPEEGDADAYDEDGEEKEEDSEEKLAAKANDTSGLDGCVAVCNQFTSQMMMRCCRRGEEGGASEFRPILANLIDDLLLVRYLIEFPAAEMLLLSLSRRLGSDLLHASAASKAQVVEATYLATAMDSFGKISSAVASTLQQNREHALRLPDSMNADDDEEEYPEPEEEVNRCFCGRGNLDTFMVDCDRCHSWFHGGCVGMTKDTVPDLWFCDDCTLRTAVLDQAKVFAARGNKGGGSKVLARKDHNHVLRQFLLSYLLRTAQSSSSPQADRAREFLIATWAKDITLEKNGVAWGREKKGAFDLALVRSHVIAQWSPPTLEGNHRSRSALTDDGNQRIMSSLVASSELSNSFPRLLGVLLKLMGDKIASLRKLSLKAFLQVVNVDPALMAQPSVRKDVSRCFHDGAISVREAAVSLVGDYVLQSPNIAAAFHAPLLERMVDKGKSVRKRAVKIFRDILLSNPSYGGRATAMHCMLQRADDRKEDDGVRDLIHETFHLLWFNGKAFEMGKSSLSLGNGLSPEDPNNPGKTMTKAQLYCREAAKAMVEVVKVSGSPEFLTSLVKGLLFGFNEGDKNKKNAERKRRQVDSCNQCNSLVLALVELLLSFEEGRTHGEEDGKELVALLSTLSVFSQSYPELLVPHVDTLVPYLKGDNGAKKYETVIVGTVSSIVSLSSSHFSSAELARLTGGELPSDLVNIAYKFPPSAVSSAVEALAKLANHPDASAGNVQEKKLFNMAVQFYSYLLKNKGKTKDFSKLKKALRDNIQRALSALGSICRYYECHDGFDSHNLDPHGFAVVTDVKRLQFSGNVLSSACFALFMEYLDKDDAQTKCLALRAMNGVFISRPRVVLAAEQLGIVTSVISETAPPSVQIESLRCWRDILLAEEIRIESGAAKEKMKSQKNISLSKRISGDQDGDACISGSVLTKHADRLYELTLSKDEKVRHMIIDLIGHLLRQGLINPMATVPHLLAVQGDVKSPSTRSLALKLLINEGEKRPDMLRQRICAGLKQAYFFQKEVYPHDSSGVPRVTALLSRTEGPKVVTDTIFDAVIKESAIRNKRAQRQGLLKGIISLFEKDPDSEHTDADQLPLLAFASEILAHLPYTALNDPLFIVYHSSCITALDGQAIIYQFTELLGGDLCDPNSEEDDIERAAKKSGTFDPNEFGLLSKSAEFGQLCVNACRILPLLQLKNFLRKAYHLSEARMTEFVPSEKERIHEKGISISDSVPPFSCVMDPIFDAQQNINWNGAVNVYATMRAMMRDSETEDLHVDTEASAKTPKRKSGQKRKRGDDDDALAQASPAVSPD
eukprot:CAMPEP_0172528242 /NCGR_PEP_ID=MMETSP1067-20121228/2692_1 /TAXON_ID=265564 ORGANISM="Thalassiosira punctigera, Strain Tpunct2005C2" /NCGR_SAMPLE_ID=MMETSP1067 /ASSEMBLY_ACC=CAM_ASM_000444 /LENGTH=1791 /DNA_ID=CAMNT_0013312123 /DNA_START=38 /DNA_END=5413 /DNA_ORIENTATION=+